MQKPLTPKKYIETKARSLPVYKCLVNKDWEEAKIANVVVMRRHTNGHVTAGVYLVDLLCLGVKDTMFFFNLPEEELEYQMGMAKGAFTEVEYPLAHNIVYAGHDYAMEFDIHPHRDFALTQFILEEDDDSIPLIDIATGSKDGKPHLMVYHHGEFADALAKLKRNAGEGNYYFTVGEVEGWDEEDEWEEDEEEVPMDEIALGELDFDMVQLVPMEDLEAKEQVEKRTVLEQVIIHTEKLMRLLPGAFTELSKEEEQSWDREMLRVENAALLRNGVSEAQMEESRRVVDQIVALQPEDKPIGEKQAERIHQEVLRLLVTHKTNPILVLSMYQDLLSFIFPDLRKAARPYAEALVERYPTVQLSLALDALMEGKRDARFETIYQQRDITLALPGYEEFAVEELFDFWMIRMWVSLDEGRPKEALYYFHLLRNANAYIWHMIPVLMRISEALLGDFLGKGEEGRS